MTAKVKKKAFCKHSAEARFNGRKGRVKSLSVYEPKIYLVFDDGESAWFKLGELK